MSNISETIRSLKPGDLVRVTREQVIGTGYDGSYVSTIVGPCLDRTDPTVTSIEVIERPLVVGDKVITKAGNYKGEITGIGKNTVLVTWDDDVNQIEYAYPIEEFLRRAS